MHPLLLLNPPGTPGTTANREGAAGMGAVRREPSGFFYPPQTLAVTAAAVRDAGHTVVIVDAVAGGMALPEAVARVDAHHPAQVGVFVSPATWPADRACLQRLHERLPATPLVAFGPATRFMVQDIEATGATRAILLGEPELAFPRLVEALFDAPQSLCGPLWPADLGASGYDEEGRLESLDSLPRPAWDLLPAYPFYTLQASRGCEEACVYCPYVVAQGRHYRVRDPRRVADEMVWLAERFRPPRLIFRDPVFARERDRVVALCHALRDRRFAVPWECESRPEHFDAPLLQTMKRAGCRVIKLGLETVAPALLVALKRVPSETAVSGYLEHAGRVIHEAQRIGLTVRLFVMVGLPGQTEDSVRETARFVQRVSPNALHVMKFVSYPALPLEEGVPAPENVAAQWAILDAVAQELGRSRPVRRRWAFWRR
ncbi:MAG: radical SAM protein [Chloroflexi bacterium]|nr:radical SAM protein [Chloroflexota bacterium]